MGRATVDLFVEHGARVVVIDRQPPLKDLPAGVLFHQGSVTSAEDWSTVLSLAETTFGVATILVNNAGILSEVKLPDMTDTEWERVMSINSTGVFYGMRAFIKNLIAKKLPGSVVNISSMAGIRTMGIGAGIAYESSKASCCHMTKSAARDHGPSGIRVNCVLPGMTITEMTIKGTGRDKEHFSTMTNDHVPLGRWSTPDEVASVVLFLASDDSSYVTGLLLVHDGGFTLC